ncbi:GCD complex subunit gcd7 [Coemansia sp. Benny D115]|nr:GCD complex subunit gcd7 [Coemansia sp. Benny D115]
MESPKSGSPNLMISQEVNNSIDEFISQLKRGKLQGSKKVAMETANLIRQIITTSRWDDTQTLSRLLKQVGQRLLRAQPRELLIVNIVCHILHIVSEVAQPTSETAETRVTRTNTPSSRGGSETPAMGLGSVQTTFAHGLADHVAGALEQENNKLYQIKSDLISEINEYIDELRDTERAISESAHDYVHSNEVILTCGWSRTVERFLLEASRKRKFHVIITECAPSYDGHEMARALESANIEVVVIPDSAVFAIMSRVNKVILGTHAVMANGGLIAASGSHMIAAAARHHSTQVVVCAGQYKQAPSFPFDDDRFNTLMAPDSVLTYGDGRLVGAVDVANTRYDYVPPDLIDILVDNHGGHLPSYLYRLLQENYDSASDLAWIVHDQ